MNNDKTPSWTACAVGVFTALVVVVVGFHGLCTSFLPICAKMRSPFWGEFSFFLALLGLMVLVAFSCRYICDRYTEIENKKTSDC